MAATVAGDLSPSSPQVTPVSLAAHQTFRMTLSDGHECLLGKYSKILQKKNRNTVKSRLYVFQGEREKIRISE